MNVQSTIVGTADSQDLSLQMSPEALGYAESRGLSVATLAKLGVASGTTFFPELGRKSEGLFFRYSTGWKARAFPEKAFVSAKGFKLEFWNLRRVLDSNQEAVFITEGECDACALVEAGIDVGQVLSVPNGAKQEAADDPNTVKGYDFVREALEAGLKRCKRVIWCGDNDGAGHALRADMVRIFGASRFWFVDWPEGVKDANEMLRTDGPQPLRELVSEGALQWPVDGLYRLDELPEPAPLTLWSPGFPEWEQRIMLAPRTLSVVTGHPGHGKTVLWAQIWHSIVNQYDVPICIASFETRPKPHLRRQLRTLISGKLEKDMEQPERAVADAWIRDRYLFVVHPDQRPTLEWLLDMAEIAVIRHGARIVQIDPWNRMEGQENRGESETQYIGRCLRAIHAFAHDMNCHVQILAHPSKMDGPRRGKPPALEDIAGSKNWENMADQGFVVHRPELFDGGQRKTNAVIYHRKARFDELGYPCQLKLNFEIDRGRYVSADYETGLGRA